MAARKSHPPNSRTGEQRECIKAQQTSARPGCGVSPSLRPPGGGAPIRLDEGASGTRSFTNRPWDRRAGRARRRQPAPVTPPSRHGTPPPRPHNETRNEHAPPTDRTRHATPNLETQHPAHTPHQRRPSKQSAAREPLSELNFCRIGMGLEEGCRLTVWPNRCCPARCGSPRTGPRLRSATSNACPPVGCVSQSLGTLWLRSGLMTGSLVPTKLQSRRSTRVILTLAADLRCRRICGVSHQMA
jgi:hypothetical protein